RSSGPTADTSTSTPSCSPPATAPPWTTSPPSARSTPLDRPDTPAACPAPTPASATSASNGIAASPPPPCAASAATPTTSPRASGGAPPEATVAVPAQRQRRDRCLGRHACGRRVVLLVPFRLDRAESGQPQRVRARLRPGAQLVGDGRPGPAQRPDLPVRLR